MTQSETGKALREAVKAARAAGALMRKNLRSAKTVNKATRHDIKLELDVRSQKLIEKKLLGAFPHIGLLGEEGDSDQDTSKHRWVVDPIDGTVNFAYGIPHACVSIALQERAGRSSEAYRTTVGVIYDPFNDELWTAVRGQPARMNGNVIHVSKRKKLEETIVSTGFAKSRESLRRGLPYFIWLVRRVRKVRMMGSAALSLTYVATGRFDAYIERGVNLWDIAAGGLILECAGGNFWHEPADNGKRHRLIASNGLLKFPVPK